MIPLKNLTNFSKIFSCLCSECKVEFCITVAPNTIGEAVCPNCQSEKIFVEYPDNQSSLLYA